MMMKNCPSKRRFLPLLAMVAIGILTSCASFYTPGKQYTRESAPRDGQKYWFTQQDLQEANKSVTQCISGSAMITDYQRSVSIYAIYLRHIYTKVSEKGQDVDAGVRALNFLAVLHQNAGGSLEFWQDALTAAKQNDPKRPMEVPVPKDY